MKNLVSLGVTYAIVGAAVALGVKAGNHVWSSKIEPKLKK